MHLIQILLPLYDNEGKSFDKNVYEAIKQELTETFGGITMYNRSPAIGIWKEKSKNVHDEIIIFEIMTEDINPVYWNAYKLKLQEIFRQNFIIIRSCKIELL